MVEQTDGRTSALPPAVEPPPADEPPKLNYFQNLLLYRKYLVIEPFFFFYLMASIFNSVAMQSFPLEKACRVNLGYNQIICAASIDKSEYGIECDNFNFENTTEGATPEMLNLGVGAMDFNYTVCKAEVEAQKLAADVSGKRAPAAAIFPLIVLLFAGGWADRYNKRKPCMIFPIIGEALSFTCLLISAIFFDSLPMEFGAYCEAIVPALFGGLTFSLMAIYSYMTISTPEEDRVFRFGIFAMFISAVPFIGTPVSGFLFKLLGYVLSFAMAISFQIIAIVLIIIYVKELKPIPKGEVDKIAEDAPPPLPTHGPPAINGADNMAYNLDESRAAKNVSFELTSRNVNAGSGELVPSKPVQSAASIADAPTIAAVPVESTPTGCKNFFREFFDPTLVLDCIRFPLVKRPNNGRLLLILLIIAYFLTLGPATGENDYWFRYTLKKLSWNGNDFSFYFTMTSAASLIGTFIGTAILSKFLKFSDSTVGILSAMCIVISRVMFAFSGNTASFYAAGVVDMFVSLRVIAIKSIGSRIVDGEELSKMYSIFGISEPIGQFIFPPIFSEIYKNTVDSFPGAIFLFGEIFYIPNVLVFVLCYFILRRNKKNIKQKAVNGETNPDCEITSL